jgi:Glyoxalase-like domain
MSVPRIDHVVVDVGDQIDAAALCYRRLGFQLTERAHHSLGSANHLAMLDPDYIELLSPGDGKRGDLAGFPIGLNGLVFAMQDAGALYQEQCDRSVPVEPVQYFTRGVQLPDARHGEARFNVVRLPPRSVFDGRVYFCEHLTPDMVWRPEWQAHPNGALGIARVALALSSPDRIADQFERMFGRGAVQREVAADKHVLTAGKVNIELWHRDRLASTLGSAMPDATGRSDHMALLGIRVRSLTTTEQVLRQNDVAFEVRDDRLVVLPAAAMNVALEFTA